MLPRIWMISEFLRQIVFFGADFPFIMVNATVDGLRGVIGMLEGTALPRLKTDKIEELIIRDTLPLLGLD